MSGELVEEGAEPVLRVGQYDLGFDTGCDARRHRSDKPSSPTRHDEREEHAIRAEIECTPNMDGCCPLAGAPHRLDLSSAAQDPDRRDDLIIFSH